VIAVTTNVEDQSDVVDLVMDAIELFAEGTAEAIVEGDEETVEIFGTDFNLNAVLEEVERTS
jgi:hypothetical protein